jgi:hypothetical protein
MISRSRLWSVGCASALVAFGALAVLSPSGVAADAGAPSCSAADLSAKQTGSGAGMSQPYSLITVTNTSGVACTLNGYPAITGAWAKSGRKAIHVTPGSLGNRSDPGPKRFVIAPGGHAWFAVGAATAYDPPLVTFTRISFSTSRGASVAASVTARLRLPATAPHGKAFPIGVTAFAPGSGT